MKAKHTCGTCMFQSQCPDRPERRACESYRREPFKLAKHEAKWTFKRKAGK